jgi:hypothetical protein
LSELVPFAANGPVVPVDEITERCDSFTLDASSEAERGRVQLRLRRLYERSRLRIPETNRLHLHPRPYRFGRRLLCSKGERGAVAYLRPVHSPMHERGIARSFPFRVELNLRDSGLPETELKRERPLEGPRSYPVVLVLPDTFRSELTLRGIQHLLSKLHPQLRSFLAHRP